MKLSQAMREGAKLRPQTHGFYFYQGGSCALGAASEVIDIDPRLGGVQKRLVIAFPELHAQRVLHPVHETDALLSKVIKSLNDNHKWSREQIADYVESLGY